MSAPKATRIRLSARAYDEHGQEQSLHLIPNGSALEAFVDVLSGAVNTYYAKNAAYGEAWRQQGWMGNLARVMSKTSRLRAMLWRGDRVLSAGGESVQDTLQDLINLAVFMTMNLSQDNEWGQDV